jgi:uncharacterized protein YbjT (DUF2867 family)
MGSVQDGDMADALVASEKDLTKLQVLELARHRILSLDEENKELRMTLGKLRSAHGEYPGVPSTTARPMEGSGRRSTE